MQKTNASFGAALPSSAPVQVYSLIKTLAIASAVSLATVGCSSDKVSRDQPTPVETRQEQATYAPANAPQPQHSIQEPTSNDADFNRQVELETIRSTLRQAEQESRQRHERSMAAGNMEF
jgi:hypothetical protein